MASSRASEPLAGVAGNLFGSERYPLCRMNCNPNNGNVLHKIQLSGRWAKSFPALRRPEIRKLFAKIIVTFDGGKTQMCTGSGIAGAVAAHRLGRAAGVRVPPN